MKLNSCTFKTFSFIITSYLPNKNVLIGLVTFWSQIPYITYNTMPNDSRKLVYQIPQESPAIADKPARRESLPKLLHFDVLTTLSLTILAYLHSFSCCCVRNLRNRAKFTEDSNLWSSRLSKVIDLGVNRKPMYDFLLVTNSNFGRICYRFRDIDT